MGRWEWETGLNFTPGAVMILVTVLVLLLCGRSFATYGLTWKRWRHNLNIGLLWTLLLVVLAGVGRMFTHVHTDPSRPSRHDEPRRGRGVWVTVTILLLWFMKGQAR